MPISAIAPIPILVGAILFESVFAILLAWVLRRRGWPIQRTIFTAASPIPCITILLCVYVFMDAALASKESCGVDACGMAMAAAVILASAAMLLYILGVAVALVTVWFTLRPKREDTSDIVL